MLIIYIIEHSYNLYSGTICFTMLCVVMKKGDVYKRQVENMLVCFGFMKWSQLLQPNVIFLLSMVKILQVGLQFIFSILLLLRLIVLYNMQNQQDASFWCCWAFPVDQHNVLLVRLAYHNWPFGAYYTPESIQTFHVTKIND